MLAATGQLARWIAVRLVWARCGVAVWVREHGCARPGFMYWGPLSPRLVHGSLHLWRGELGRTLAV